MNKKNRNSIFKIFKFAGNYKILIILSSIFSIISAILSLFPFICIWFVVKEIFSVLPNITKATETIKYGYMAVGFSVTSIALYFLSLILSHLSAFRVEKNMKKEAMRKIVTLPFGFFTENTTGKLRKIIDDNACLTHVFLAHQLPDLFGIFTMPIAIFIILFVFDWRLGLVCLLPMFLSILFLNEMMGGKNAKFMNNYMDALEDMNSSAVEYVRGIPVVKTFQQTVYSFKNFHRSIKNYSKFASGYSICCRIPMIKFTLSINSPSILLIPIGLIIILNCNNYKMFLLDLIFYMLFSPLCTTMMSRIMYSGENIMVVKQALKRIDEILDAKPLNQNSTKYQIKNYDIKFKNVVFSYSSNKEPAIDNLSFSIDNGKTYALVGPSGGGKTTLASLIPRFWDIDSGQILIGGVDIRNIDEKELMSKISFVFQNSKLFKKSLFENVKIGKKTATRQEVLKALHLAQCDNILEKLPNGLDTILETQEVYLSGGEKQRISLARAILKNAPIVILDEATAFADPENEYKVKKAFEPLVKNKTVIMIAHRLSSIKDVDCIFVLNKGKIIESGNHEELLKKKNVYANMWSEYQKSVSWKVEKEDHYA